MEDNELRIEVYRRQRNMALDAMAEIEMALTLKDQELAQCKKHIAELEKMTKALTDQMPTVT